MLPFRYRNSQTLKTAAKMFQFYEHLLSIDLSTNIIEVIEDKSFAAQKLLLKLILSDNRIRDLSAKVKYQISRVNQTSPVDGNLYIATN